MEHIAALLLIVGCSGDLSQCRELPSPVTVFETAEECTAVRPFALEDLRGRAPRILGQCIPVDPALEEEYGEIVWDVRSDGTLTASVETSGMVVAENGHRPEKDYLGQE
jgi:hypothetical protein